MPTFMATLGFRSSVAGLSSLSQLFFSDASSSHNHYSPHSSSTFRSGFLKPPPRNRSLRVSVSGTAAGNGVVENEPSDEPLDDEEEAQEREMGSSRRRLPSSVDTTKVSSDWEAARSYKDRGMVYEGRVLSVNSGGMLVKFYSLVGFLPYSQLSQANLCEEPNITIRRHAKSLVGSLISVKVIKAEEANQSLILSERQASWSMKSEKIRVGDIFDGRVTCVEDYGAFVDLRFPDGLYHLTGLVHVSEVSWDLVQDVRGVLRVGDEVRVKVIKIDKGKSRISLSIKLLEEDPLLQTLDKVIPQNGSAFPSGSGIIPLPGLETIMEELLREDGIEDVRISQQGFEKRVVAQDLQLWLSNAPPVDKQFTLLARAGRQVQEILLSTSLDQEGIKKALQRVLERVP